MFVRGVILSVWWVSDCVFQWAERWLMRVWTVELTPVFWSPPPHTGAWGHSNSVPLEPGAHWKHHRGVTPVFLLNKYPSMNDAAQYKRLILVLCCVVGQSGHTEEDQGFTVWSGQRGGDREPLRPAAQRDSRQELRELLRLLREVGAAGASASALQGERAEPEIQWVGFHLFVELVWPPVFRLIKILFSPFFFSGKCEHNCR